MKKLTKSAMNRESLIKYLIFMKWRILMMLKAII